MIINTSELKDFLKKATLNFSIESVQLNLKKDTVTSRMISSASDAMSILNLPNNILPQMKETDILVMNFSEPNTNLIPYLNLIDDDIDTEVKIFDEKITLVQGKQKSNIFFCAPQVVSVFASDNVRSDVEYFHSITLDDDFVESFAKIKKIGAKFSKVYFGVENNVLYIETSDKQNRFSNGLRLDLCDVDYDNMSMCFDFKNVSNLMSVLGDRYNEFTCNFAYVAEQELGMISVNNEDKSELFFIMSRRDNG